MVIDSNKQLFYSGVTPEMLSFKFQPQLSLRSPSDSTSIGTPSLVGFAHSFARLRGGALSSPLLGRRLQVIDKIVKGGARVRRAAPVLIPVQGANEILPVLPPVSVAPSAPEPASLGRRIITRTKAGLGNAYDALADSIGEKVLPAIVSGIIGRILQRVEGKKGKERQAEVKGGAFMIADIFKTHNKIISPPAAERLLLAHRKGRRPATMRKFAALA